MATSFWLLVRALGGINKSTNQQINESTNQRINESTALHGHSLP
jgi:hypothetical protein